LKSQQRRSRVRRYMEAARASSIGYCPCFVCNEPVFTTEELKQRGLSPKALNAARPTYEHIVPKSRGGKDHLQNFAVSHELCNHKRGNEYDPAK